MAPAARDASFMHVAQTPEPRTEGESQCAGDRHIGGTLCRAKHPHCVRFNTIMSSDLIVNLGSRCTFLRG